MEAEVAKIEKAELLAKNGCWKELRQLGEVFLPLTLKSTS